MELTDYITSQLYTPSLFGYKRRQSREVRIGDLAMGGNNPIRVQSMTTTDTLDTAATVAQSIRMIEAGCELVRITAPSLKEAENLRNIKDELRKAGYNTPLVADIHFTPNAAELAARIVEKVRINPGNYVDKKKFEQKEYTDSEYEAEIERIRKRFEPLVKICKEYGTAMRIGTNHGSLSDRIMNRYGDTPMGMVESAMEFLRICEDLNYYDIVLSMKSSNPIVMVEAYRLLVSRMDEEGMNYPLHLGVTEAGEGDEGRIKSAMGIGTLLADGLGDTVRVSLTEEPEFEIPVARALADRYMSLWERGDNHSAEDMNLPAEFNPYHHGRRTSSAVFNLGGLQVPRVIADFSRMTEVKPENLKSTGHIYDAGLDKWHMTDQGADFIYFGSKSPGFMLPNGLRAAYDYKTWVNHKDKSHSYPVFLAGEYADALRSPELNFILFNPEKENSDILDSLGEDRTAVLVLQSNEVKEARKVFFELMEKGIRIPVILQFGYSGLSREDFILQYSSDAGTLLSDGLGDGLLISYPENRELANQTSFNILQAARMRISKTEYISCPSCGRTLFNLQDTTAMIRKETDHLKGVKIAIMGCIVNGPGEMADADYGYVGTGPGKITLYRGKEVIKRNIDSQFALQELINLIREDGLWTDREAVRV
jgi:(E)-4-hydroxy-3-methylbut-2-enyl-diphosphate synthase